MSEHMRVWVVLGLASVALVLHSVTVLNQRDVLASSENLRIPSKHSRHSKDLGSAEAQMNEPVMAAHTAKLAAISAPYEMNHRISVHVRRRLEDRQRAIAEAAARRWPTVDKVATPPKRAHVSFRQRVSPYVVHLPNQQIENTVPCTSNCDWIQSRALKAAEGLVELAKRTHDARALAARTQSARDEKIIRSLRAKLSHIVPDPTGRCLATLSCSDCEVTRVPIKYAISTLAAILLPTNITVVPFGPQ